MIEIDIDPNLLSLEFVGSFILSWHGFFSFVAVAAAVVLVGRWAPMRGVDPDAIYSIAIWAIIGGVVGARVVHVVDNWGPIYSQNPGQIFAIYSGGIGLWGGILGGFLGGAAYAMYAKFPVGVIADLTAPVMLFSQSIGRIGDFINGEHCANATDLSIGFLWTNAQTVAAVCKDGGPVISSEGVVAGLNSAVQPVIAYEVIWNMLALIVVWKLIGRLKPDGMLFALYLALYSVGRFGVTFLREDRVWGLGMQEAHYIALLVLLITIPLLAFRARLVEREPVAAEASDKRTRAQRRRPKR